MQLAQKISVSLDPGSMGFMEAYRIRNKSKSRSSVINEALRALEQREQERVLEWAYQQSAPSDRIVAEAFSASDADGLADQAW